MANTNFLSSFAPLKTEQPIQFNFSCDLRNSISYLIGNEKAKPSLN